MVLKFFVWPLVGSFFLLTVDFNAAQGAHQRYDLTVIYTNDVLGEIEPCG
ncbi:MAG: hypothetical protein GTO13_07115 [Proteobacteria bacterium]|nr:hypothetical protein [Pseudomonadota bacterium]